MRQNSAPMKLRWVFSVTSLQPDIDLEKRRLKLSFFSGIFCKIWQSQIINHGYLFNILSYQTLLYFSSNFDVDGVSVNKNWIKRSVAFNTYFYYKFVFAKTNCCREKKLKLNFNRHSLEVISPLIMI